MNKKIIYILGGAAVLIGGYVFYLTRQAEKLMDIQYRVQNIKFDTIALNKVKARADIVLNNPSDVRFTINGYNIDIYFRGRKIANIQKSNINTVLVANGAATLPIEVQLDPVSVTENLLSILLSSVTLGEEQVKGIRYVGKISGRFGLIGFKNIDVDYTYQ